MVTLPARSPAPPSARQLFRVSGERVFFFQYMVGVVATTFAVAYVLGYDGASRELLNEMMLTGFPLLGNLPRRLMKGAAFESASALTQTPDSAREVP